MRENESLIKVSVFAFHEKMGVLNFVQMNVHMYQNMKGYWKLGWGRSRGICSVCQTENWWEMSLNSGRKLWMRRGFSLVRASWCEDKNWKCWWRFTSRMLDKVRWKLRRGLNDRSECLKMMTVDMFEYENVMSMWKCVNSGYLPDDGPSGSAGWSWMTWVMGTDYGQWHWLWYESWYWYGIWYWSVIMAYGTDHDAEYGTGRVFENVNETDRRHKTWPWYWSWVTWVMVLVHDLIMILKWSMSMTLMWLVYEPCTRADFKSRDREDTWLQHCFWSDRDHLRNRNF